MKIDNNYLRNNLDRIVKRISTHNILSLIFRTVIDISPIH